jgi:hypothetical protein
MNKRGKTRRAFRVPKRIGCRSARVHDSQPAPDPCESRTRAERYAMDLKPQVVGALVVASAPRAERW